MTEVTLVSTFRLSWEGVARPSGPSPVTFVPAGVPPVDWEETRPRTNSPDPTRPLSRPVRRREGIPPPTDTSPVCLPSCRPMDHRHWTSPPPSRPSRRSSSPRRHRSPVPVLFPYGPEVCGHLRPRPPGFRTLGRAPPVGHLSESPSPVSTGSQSRSGTPEEESLSCVSWVPVLVRSTGGTDGVSTRAGTLSPQCPDPCVFHPTSPRRRTPGGSW